jgi:hypothetical protein
VPERRPRPGHAGGKMAPPNEPPQLWRASAAQEEGKVVIQIARPEYVSPRKAVAAEVMKWDYMRKVTLGDGIRAYEVNGKRIAPDAVLTALAEPKGVAVFVRYGRTLIDPDPFYLALLREGAIVLVADAAEIGPLAPAP